MNLPNYFLADLPPETVLSPLMLSEACQTLKRNREQYLLRHSTQDRIHLVSEVAGHWLKPGNRFRELALEHGPAATGFSRATLTAGIDAFFAQLTPENLSRLVEQEFGHPQRLDRFVSTRVEEETRRSSRVVAPELIAHIAAGNLPNPALLSLVLGVLLRSAQFLKCATGTSWLPRLFAHSLYEAEPKLGACLEIAEWRGGQVALEAALFEQADCVTATGSDEALAAIQQRLPAKTRFVGHGHRVSFGFVTSGMLTGLYLRSCAARAAADVTAWDQQGCLSPHVFYVQEGGVATPEQFAALLAEELERREQTEPRGPLSVEAAAAIASRRNLHEVRAAHSGETKLWCSRNSTAWTVVYETDPRFQLSCLNRFVYVKGVADLAQGLQNADHVRHQVSTVGLGALDHEASDLAAQLGPWGASRICPLGQMQNPPLGWRHDGRPPLGELVTWVDWEK